MNAIKIKDIILVSIAFLGFAYGLFKDRKLKQIEKRGKSPYFIVQNLEIELKQNVDIPSGNIISSYPEKLNDISGPLFDLSKSNKEVPQDYPDRRVIGLLLENTGMRIRYFEIFCKEDILFRKYHPLYVHPSTSKQISDGYEFRYWFNRSKFGNSLKFQIRFELESGHQGKQVWLTEQGRATLKRIRPRSIS